MAKETPSQSKNRVNEEGCSITDGDDDNLVSCSSHSSESVSGLETCRVCQCLESDTRGDTALEFLGIAPPLQLNNVTAKDAENDVSTKKNVRESHFMELISPDGEVLICRDDLELGLDDQKGSLIELGCSCKNDLALVHYACALKWFVNHGSTVCEICSHVAKNIRTSDFRKVICALKEYEALRERTASGDPNPTQVHTSM